MPESTSDQPDGPITPVLYDLTLDAVTTTMEIVRFSDGETVTRQVVHHPKRARLESDPDYLELYAFEHRIFVITDSAGQPVCQCSRSYPMPD